MGNVSESFFGREMGMTAYEKKQAMLVAEFNRYVMEHPDFAAQIPVGAQIVIEPEEEEAFNAWTRSLAERQRGSRARWKHPDGRATTIPMHASTAGRPRLIFPLSSAPWSTPMKP